MTRIVIIGGGPAGYEAALVAAQLGADVTVVERDGLGGASVLTDCVPSKTLIAAAGAMTAVRDSAVLGLQGTDLADVSLDIAAVNQRIRGLAVAQSADIHARLESVGVRCVSGQARLSDEIRGLIAHRVEICDFDGGVQQEVEADVVLIATGADPRVLPGAEPDGDRILSWRDVYDLEELPEHLVVVGSGVTGAEFASGYLEAGVPVTWSPRATRSCRGGRRRRRRGRAGVPVPRREDRRAGSGGGGHRTATGVEVRLTDGRCVAGSHALMTVGTVPNTDGLNLEKCGVAVSPSGHVVVDRVPAPRCPASTPPATSPASSSSPRSRPCRAASPCGTPWARPCRRSGSRPWPATCSPTGDRHRRVQEKTLPEGSDIDSVQLPLATNARPR